MWDPDANELVAEIAQGFLTGYAKHIDTALEEVRTAIDQRVSKLAGWLARPSTVPLVISKSSDDWRKELMGFVHAYEAGRFEGFFRGVSECAK
jgi:hypothetical protein